MSSYSDTDFNSIFFLLASWKCPFSHYYSIHQKITFVDKVGEVEEYKEGTVVSVSSSLCVLTFRQIFEDFSVYHT